MNFVAHVHTALSVLGRASPEEGSEVDFAFGAALPDLVSMAGFRLTTVALPGRVREGVSFHHRTDALFHARGDFIAGVAGLRRRLQAEGVATGASRAAAHAGWEMLLDGCLLDSPGVADGFNRVVEGAPDLGEVLEPAAGGRWHRLLGAMRQDQWWLGYREAEAVARGLERRLRSRRRLALLPADVPRVAAALADARASVAATAVCLVPELAAQLATPPSQPPPEDGRSSPMR